MATIPLARKAIAVTFVAVLVMVSVPLAATHIFVLRHIGQLEESRAKLATERVRAAISLKQQDFAYHGDALENTLRFNVSNLARDPPFSFAQLAAAEGDIFAILREDATPLWQGRINQTARTIEPLSPSEAQLLSLPTLHPQGRERLPMVGFVVHQGRTYLAASCAIAGEPRSVGSEPHYIAFAKAIDGPWLATLGKLTATTVEIRPITPSKASGAPPSLPRLSAERPPVISLTEDEAQSESALEQLGGGATLLLDVRVERRLGPLGTRIYESFGITSLLAGFSILAAVYFIVQRRLIAPLGKLQGAVRKLEQGQHSSVILNRDDELGELASGFNRMARTMRERETVLRQAHAELKLILDSTADTLCGCNLTGGFRGEPSAMGPRWFGAPQPDQGVASWLFGEQPKLVAIFQLALAQVADEKLPLAVALDQLPQRFQRGTSCYEIVYRPIHEGDDLIGLLLVIKDITAKIKAESAEREARELQIVVGNLMRNRSAFEHFVGECEGLLQQMHLETRLPERLVHLHTLKGACSIFGLLSFSDACLALERQIAVNADAMNEEALRTLRKTFQATLNRVRRFAPKADETRLSISLGDYSNFVELLEKRLGHERLLAEAMKLPLEPGERLVAKLVQQAQTVAHELGKELDVDVDDGGTRLVAESTHLLWSSLAHGIRNAVEHGIETPEERVNKGKPPRGSLRIVIREKGHHLAVSLIDDGRGVDWPALQKRAYTNRLPSKREDLMELLFTDGLSTKTETASITGRGVGLSAIRATCHALGGTCIVYAGPEGIGTELYCTISMAVATVTASGVHLPPSHTRLSVKPDADNLPHKTQAPVSSRHGGR